MIFNRGIPTFENASENETWTVKGDSSRKKAKCIRPIVLVKLTQMIVEHNITFLENSNLPPACINEITSDIYIVVCLRGWIISFRLRFKCIY